MGVGGYVSCIAGGGDGVLYAIGAGDCALWIPEVTNEWKVVDNYETWNYVGMEMLKLGDVLEEEVFRQTAAKHFTEY